MALKMKLEDSKRKMHDFSDKLNEAVKEQQSSSLKDSELEMDDKK